jgi:hypothetical protein
MIKFGKYRIVSQRELTAEWGQGYDVGQSAAHKHVESMIHAQIKFLQKTALPATVKETRAGVLELKFILGKLKSNVK